MPKLSTPKIFLCQNPMYSAENVNRMDAKALFEKAVEESKMLPTKPTNETLLMLYSLYKQATIGDINIDFPSNPFDFVAKAKYDAWLSLKGTTIKDAQNNYIELVEKLKT